MNWERNLVKWALNSKIVIVAANEATNMIGKNSGFVQFLGQEVTYLISFHCILHQESVLKKKEN